MLEEVILASNSLVVKESALQLLTDYGVDSFDKLKEGFEEIEPEIRAEVNYLLEMP
ncbi:hypothetical protein [Candidatus Enterococcus clewellii]|uniref:hypothetical protein n=1 Tax=Candidatus Enterococcus clewellii TaxID=1834193 RepID=UPI001BAEDFA3|nr:hypothetical protein [Enterococcus sp. 9E7_DIV0242]